MAWPAGSASMSGHRLQALLLLRTWHHVLHSPKWPGVEGWLSVLLHLQPQCFGR